MAKKARKKAKAKAAGMDFFGGGGGLLADVFSGAPATEQKVPTGEAKGPAVEKGPLTIAAMETAKPAAPHVEKGPVTGKVIDKYGNVEIISVETEPTPYYKTALPELGAKEIALLEKVKDTAIEEVRIDPEKLSDAAERNRIFTQAVFKILERESRAMRLPPGRMRQLGELAVRDMIGFGLLDPLLADDRLEDIMVTAVGKPVYVYHRKHGMCHTNIIFNNEDSIKYLIDKMARVVGRRIDQQTPLLDARLPDGSRVNATIPPVSLDGPTISIRKFRKDPLSVIDIINFNTLSTDLAAFLWFAVDGLGSKPANLLLSGGTGCGKTTMLNAATNFVPGSERIISIEDTAELQLPHKHWVRMETRPPNVEGKGEITMDDLVKNALRMRPDRMVVGEVRGPEARTMFTAMNTGHDGCMGTVHANSAAETVTRLTEAPMSVPAIMIPALDLIVMQQRLYHRQKGQIRRVTEVAEVSGIEGGQPQLSRIFKWNAKVDKLESTGVPSRLKRTIGDYAGISGHDVEMEINKRGAVLEWMKERGIRNVFEVGKIIQDYYRDPESIMKRVKTERGKSS
ncbi:MAG: CpaF family protein [Candidatus Hadarchaeota archaeon]